MFGLCAVVSFEMHATGLDKLAQQKRDDAGGKPLPGLGKRSRLDLDDAEEQEAAPSTSERDTGSKGQARHYRSSRIDTPSHPGMQSIFTNGAVAYDPVSTCYKLSRFGCCLYSNILTITAVAGQT